MMTTLKPFTRTEANYLQVMLTGKERAIEAEVKSGAVRPSEAAMELVTIDKLKLKVSEATDRVR